MSDLDTVIARHEAFIASFATQDLAKMAEFLTEDHVGMAPGRPALTGRAEAQEFWSQGFAVANSEFTSHSQHVQVSGDFAIDRFHWGMKLSPHDGGPGIKDAGKCVWIWRRDGDGAWRVATAIWNSDQTEPTPWTGA